MGIGTFSLFQEILPKDVILIIRQSNHRLPLMGKIVNCKNVMTVDLSLLRQYVKLLEGSTIKKLTGYDPLYENEGVHNASDPLASSTYVFINQCIEDISQFGM